MSIAHGIDNFEQALSGELNRFRAGLRQLQTAALEVQQTLDSAQNDFAFDTVSASSEDAWHASRAEASAEALAMAALLADVDRDVEVIQRGRASTTHVAAAGDTWESLADAICDRLVHNAHVVALRGGSMRKKKAVASEGTTENNN